MSDTAQLALPKTVADLLSAAKAATGLSNFGDPQFMTGLSHVTDGFMNEAKLSVLGEQMAYGGLLNYLINRLRYVRDIELHPEILTEKIVKPIIILGLPRTGTTKLQRVLSADPNSQAMLYWRMMNPAPFPDEEPGNPSGRIEAAKASVQMLTEHFPDFMARHPTDAMLPDEEILLMQGSFQCLVTWLFHRMSSFYDYAMQADPLPTYQYLHGQMQYLQWQDGGGRGRPWVLKSPCHTGVIDTLLKVFPDAVLVNCHRDLGKVIPSISALVVAMRGLYSDRVDSSVIGSDMLDYFGRSIDQYLLLRAKLPADRILDIPYEDVLADAAGVVRRIYDHAGFSVTAETIAAIASYEGHNPQHQFGSYKYSINDYGITSEMIDARFAEYQQCFSDFIHT